MNQRLLEPSKAAEYLGISVSTLGRHVPVPVLRIGSRTFYDVRDLDDYVDGLKRKPVVVPEDDDPTLAMFDARTSQRC